MSCELLSEFIFLLGNGGRGKYGSFWRWGKKRVVAIIFGWGGAGRCVLVVFFVRASFCMREWRGGKFDLLFLVLQFLLDKDKLLLQGKVLSL